MKYCRWSLIAVKRMNFDDCVVFRKSFRTIDEAVRVCVGFTDEVDFYLNDNDNDVTLDISDYVDAQRDFEKHFYCTR